MAIKTDFSRLGPDGHSGQAEVMPPRIPTGGPKPGSGRPPGIANMSKFEMAIKAREWASTALETLAWVCQNSESDLARIRASTEILDRAYGKPTQAVMLKGDREDGEPIRTITNDMTNREAVDILAAAIKADKL